MNRVAKTYDYDLFENYVLIWFRPGQVAVVTIDEIVAEARGVAGESRYATPQHAPTIQRGRALRPNSKYALGVATPSSYPGCARADRRRVESLDDVTPSRLSEASRQSCAHAMW
jgi:hypothetical protein